MPRIVIVTHLSIPSNYCLILASDEVEAWHRYQSLRRKLRSILKQRAMLLNISVVCVYHLENLIEAWKVKAVDW